MPVAIVMSGGGSRGDFQLGAISALYDAGIRPDIICGTSVGALNALMLTQGENGIDDLRKIWLGLRRNDHMWEFESWWSDVQPNLRQAMQGAITGDNSDTRGTLWSVATGTIAIGGIGGVIAGPLGVLTGSLIGAAVTGTIQNVAADAFVNLFAILGNNARSLFNLNPIRSIFSERFDANKLAQFISSGKKLRLATVGLESGKLFYVTETGAMVSADGSETLPGLIPIFEGALASSSISAVFPPVSFAGDAWVDGGHRENIPLRAAIQAGATQIYVICASPVDRASAVNRLEDAAPAPTDYENRRILDIAKRGLIDITGDEVAANDLYPLIDSNPQLSITTISPEYPSHDILTIDPELIRINYDYGYRTAWDVLNNSSASVREASTTIALRQARASRLRKVTWRGIGIPFSAEIETLNSEANTAIATRTAQGIPVTGTRGTSPFSRGFDLLPSELLLPDCSIVSPNGQFTFIHQIDGNLVIYQASEGNRFANVIWANNVFGFSPGVCVMQRDGNLVVYDADRVARWASGTDGNKDSTLRLQDDGNLVLLKDSRVIWQTKTEPPANVSPVTIVNTSPTTLVVRFYNVNDGLRVATLPDGTRTIPPGNAVSWALPAGFQEVQVTFTQILHQYILTDYHRTQNMRKRAWKNIDENSEHHSPLRPTNTLHVTRSDAQSLPET